MWLQKTGSSIARHSGSRNNFVSTKSLMHPILDWVSLLGGNCFKIFTIMILKAKEPTNIVVKTQCTIKWLQLSIILP